MRKYNKISIALLIFTVLFCISVAIGTVSAVDTENTGPTVTANLTGGTYNTTQTVNLTANDSSATIYYTNDTTDPRTSATKIIYREPITISSTTTLRYAAIDANDDWSPVYLQNYVIGTGTVTNNTGQSNYTGPQTNNTDWTYTITDGCRIDSSAAVGSDGTIYFGTINGETKDGYFYALKPDGTLKWRYHTGGIRSTPTIGSDGTIYVKIYNGTEYAFNPDGSLKWSITEPTVDSGFSTVGADGTRYIVTNGFLYAYKPDGTLKWTYNTETMYGFRLNALCGTPVIGADGTIYVVGRYNVVYWDDEIGLIIASQKCNLYAVNPDGMTKWIYETGYGGSGPVIGPDGTVYVTVNKHAFANPEGVKLLAINPDNGKLKWSYTNTSDGLGSLSIAKDGTIYFASIGYLFAYTPNGTEKWKYAIGSGDIYGCTIGADGTIYLGKVASLQTYGVDVPGFTDLYALNPDGKLKWTYHVGGVSGSPTIGPDGTLYAGGYATNTFYAFKDDTTKPTVTANPASGSYYAPISVTLTANETSEIYYTLDGTDPTKNSDKKYTGPIDISTSKTLKFTAWDNAGNQSQIYTEKYSIYAWTPYSYPVTVQYRLSNKKYKIKYRVAYTVKKKIKKKWVLVTKYKWKYKWDYRYGYRTETRWGNHWVLT